MIKPMEMEELSDKFQQEMIKYPEARVMALQREVDFERMRRKAVEKEN